MESKLSRDFFLRDTIEIARGLIGKRLVHVLPDGQRLSGMITETEAYLGVDDPASHAYGGRRTNRTETMYRQGGTSYVYFIYGMYHCFNVVTAKEGTPEAVLIRGLLPLEGLEVMQKMSPKRHKASQIADGPGKLCRALRINKEQNNWDLLSDRLFISTHRSFVDDLIEELPRVGIDYAGDAAHWPLRFRLINANRN